MNKKNWLLRSFGIALFGAANLLQVINAAPISIDFEFSSIDVVFNGALTSTGDITVSIRTDTANPNLGAGFWDFEAAYTADVYFTAAALGLNGSRVTNPTQLYFGGEVVGFKVNEFSTIFTAFIGPQLQFGSRFDLSTIVVPQGPVALNGTEFRTGEAITFDNGSFFDAGAYSTFFTQTNLVYVNAGAVEDVPEPEAIALLGAAILLLGAGHCRRIAKSLSSLPWQAERLSG